MDRPSHHDGFRPLLGALASAVFVVLALAAEILAGLGSNSPVPAWADGLFPLSWPKPARVAWWLAVAAAALVFRHCLARLGIRQRPVVVVLAAAPFLVFAAGVALGSDWATWH